MEQTGVANRHGRPTGGAGDQPEEGAEGALLQQARFEIPGQGAGVTVLFLRGAGLLGPAPLQRREPFEPVGVLLVGADEVLDEKTGPQPAQEALGSAVGHGEAAPVRRAGRGVFALVGAMPAPRHAELAEADAESGGWHGS